MSTVSETNQLDVGGWSSDTLHAWVRSMFDQIDRRNEQRFVEQETALDKALISSKEVMLANLTERDKAVAILAASLNERIRLGETSLRSHIAEQVSQIREALISAKELNSTQDRAVEQRIVGVELQIKGVHREIDIEAAATKTAIGKADTANEKRFESVNEFRAQLADQSALFISRREVEAKDTSIAEKVASITDRINRSEGRGTGKEQLWGYIVGGVGLLLAGMMYLNSHKPAAQLQPILNDTKIDAMKDEIRELRDATRTLRPAP